MKVIFAWVAMLGMIAFWVGFWLWWNRGSGGEEEEPANFAQVLFFVIVGFGFLGAGVFGYLLAVFTQCLTFDFTREVWGGLKAKLYIANIIVPLLFALGLGFIVSPFLKPVLTGMGLNPGVAGLMPVLLLVGILQAAQLWILIWAPLERRVIRSRAQALGATPEQLTNAWLIGISDPTRSSLKKLTLVEDDIGAMWIGPDQLVFLGDQEQFGISRIEIKEINRKADAGSTSLLGGTTHVILRVLTEAGEERQIRLHTEGEWTQGSKRRAMDDLAEAITGWHGATAPTPPPIPPGAEASST